MNEYNGLKTVSFEMKKYIELSKNIPDVNLFERIDLEYKGLEVILKNLGFKKEDLDPNNFIFSRSIKNNNTEQLEDYEKVNLHSYVNEDNSILFNLEYTGSTPIYLGKTGYITFLQEGYFMENKKR